MISKNKTIVTCFLIGLGEFVYYALTRWGVI